MSNLITGITNQDGNIVISSATGAVRLNFSSAITLSSANPGGIVTPLIIQNSAAIATSNEVQLTLAASSTSIAWYIRVVQDSTLVGNSRLTISQAGASFNAISIANLDGGATFNGGGTFGGNLAVSSLFTVNST